MSSATSLLTAATAVSRSASAVVAKAVRGFQVLRIDGYSLTKMLIPGGENISSNRFFVGGRAWSVDYYPNGADRSKDSGYISLYLRLLSNYNHNERVSAQYKFSLLDAAGNPAFEHPAQTSLFTCSCEDLELQVLRCGHGEFIRREELERRRDSLLKDDCLAIRCDVGCLELEHRDLEGKYSNTAQHDPHYWSDDSDYDSYDEEPRRRRRNRRQPDDEEFIRRCLAEHRHHK